MIKAKHAIITPTCRENHGRSGAFDDAVERLCEEYDFISGLEANEGANFHLILYVERPEKARDAKVGDGA